MKPPRRLRAVTVLLLSIASTSCARPTVPAPTPVIEPPAVTPPVVVERARTAIAAGVRDARYDIQTVTRVARDSAGRTTEQRIESHAQVTVSYQRVAGGDLRGSGRIDSFTVRGPALAFDASTKTAASAPVGLERMFFDAVLDAQSLRVVARPLLANECDRPETGAMALAREVLPRLPQGVVVGDRWSDSSITLVCRSSVPIALRQQSDYLVERIDDQTHTVDVRRTIAIRMDGKVALTWRSLEVAGTGTGTQRLKVDAARGAVVRVDGTTTVTLLVTDRSRSSAPRTQRLVQQVELRVVSKP